MSQLLLPMTALCCQMAKPCVTEGGLGVMAFWHALLLAPYLVNGPGALELTDNTHVQTTPGVAIFFEALAVVQLEGVAQAPPCLSTGSPSDSRFPGPAPCLHKGALGGWGQGTNDHLHLSLLELAYCLS